MNSNPSREIVHLYNIQDIVMYMESNVNIDQKQMSRIPRNFVRELETLTVVIAIGAIIITFSSDSQIVLALGSGLFTGAIVGAITLTSNAFRERRANLEKLAVLGVRLHSRLQWITPARIDTYALPEIDNMLSELRDADAIFGRLWFFREVNRTKAFELYTCLTSVSNVELDLIQYRLTTEKRTVDVEKLNIFFADLYKDDPDIVERLNKLTDWAIVFCGNAHF